IQLLGMMVGGIGKERVDRGEPRVAGLDTVAANVLEVLEETRDRLGGQVGQFDLGRRYAALGMHMGQQHFPGVTVGGHRVGAGAALADEIGGEEMLQCWRQDTHRRPPAWAAAWTLSLTRLSNSGLAVRYQ